MKSSKLLTKLKQIWKGESGMISILVTLLSLIAVLVVSFLIDRTNQNFIIQEVRGIMDSSAQNTLVSVLSDSHLKEELFGFSGGFISESAPDGDYPIPADIKAQLLTTYNTQLSDYVKTSNVLLGYQIEEANFKFAKGKWGLGSVASKSRPYLVLDSVVQLRLSHTQSFDYSNTFKNTTYEDVDGNTFEIQAFGSPINSEILLVVRSVTRAVFR